MTLKAAKILENCNVWFVPSAFENGGSMALNIASGVVSKEGKTIINHRFPMKQICRGGVLGSRSKKGLAGGCKNPYGRSW